MLAIFFTDLGLELEQYVLLNAIWAAAVFLFEVPSGARADTINVRSAELRADEDQIFLNAEFDFSLSPTLEEALQRGIPLYFQGLPGGSSTRHACEHGPPVPRGGTVS